MTDTFARFIVGDSLSVLCSLPDASVDLVLSSPPFLGLRSYLPSGHPDKRHEIGSEGTPGAFIDVLLDVAEECRRVLTPHGSLCFELGDSYSGSGGSGGDYNEGGLRENQAKYQGTGRSAKEAAAKIPWRTNDKIEEERNDGLRSRGGRTNRPADVATGIAAPRNRPGPEGHDHIPGWPLDKSLCLIPESFRWALVYGRNPFTGRETPRWRARNVVRWCRPNPPVGALADKVRPATSDIIVACTGRSRYFDLDGIRDEHKRPPESISLRHGDDEGTERNHNHGRDSFVNSGNAVGAPPLDHWWYDEDTFDQDAWLVSTEPYHGSHYATWPRSLLVRPIVAMCPPKVCTVCGKPSERIVAPSAEYDAARCKGDFLGRSNERDKGLQGERLNGRPNAEYLTVGWSDCGHDAWRAGVTLDPFAGSGTTLAVAHGHGRSSIGIDLDERNADLARERVGMWLTVEQHQPAEASPA